MVKFNDYQALKNELAGFEKIAIFIDSNCAKLLQNHPDWQNLNALISALKNKCMFISIPGESAKSFRNLETALEFLCEHNLSRKDCVLNIGGGVISDLGGLAAALYKRGCEHINIATTLLAAADASVGGKTGINNTYGKNLIGVFKAPKQVYFFGELLGSLSAQERACGWAEIIKMFACFDQTAYENVCQFSADEAVKLAVSIKEEVVQKDFKESSYRMLLNYGHTFAHAIEHEQRYEILHGQAVAAGMIMADELSRELGLLSEPKSKLASCLEHFGAISEYKIQDLDEFISCMQKDKKNHSEQITFILRTDTGAVIKNDVDLELVKRVLKGFL